MIKNNIIKYITKVYNKTYYAKYIFVKIFKDILH